MNREKINTHRAVVCGLCLFFIAGSVFSVTGCGRGGADALISQEPLPYAENALEPYISAVTLRLHYGKHHAGYVERAKQLLKADPFGGKSIPEILEETRGKAEYASTFNNVAQSLNHAFFWKCLRPGGGGAPEGMLLEKINASFGSVEEFRKAFLDAALGQFGSGWVWLVQEGEALKITATANADTPLAHGLIPLFTVDVWEHAYYLDYQNRRAEFVQGVMDNLINWEFVADQLKAGQKTE